MLNISQNEEKLYIHPNYTQYGSTLDGRVFSLKFEKIKQLKQTANNYGYLGFTICLNKKQIQMLLHHFIYECVTGKVYNYSTDSSDGLTINHNDRNKLNNHFSNLSELPNRDNLRDKVIIRKYDLPRYVYSSKQPRSKPYFVVLYHNKKYVRYGSYSTAEEAEVFARQKFKELFPNDNYDQ
jgi:hypothetical protein